MHGSLCRLASETWNRKIALAHTRLRKAEYEARWARVSK
jgi:hypothetical protein